MGIVEILSTTGKVIAATWRHGSRFLFSIAGICAAAAIVLRLGVYLQMAKADGFWTDYGLVLIIAAAVFGVLAAIKSYAERQNTGVVLIPDVQQSLWHHAQQPDGTMNTQFSLRFHVTNMNQGALHISGVRFNWPWFARDRILSSNVIKQHPEQNVFGRGYAIQPRARRECSADVLVLGAVGGAQRRKPMRVSISLQDHAGRWHRVVFRQLRDPQFPRTYRHRSWVRAAVVAACIGVVIVLAILGWSFFFKNGVPATVQPNRMAAAEVRALDQQPAHAHLAHFAERDLLRAVSHHDILPPN